MLFFPDVDGPITNAYNALVRFAIYGGIMLFLVFKNSSYLMAIPLVMLATYMLYTLSPPPRELMSLRDHINHIRCTKPTKENPMMNVMLHEYSKDPNRGPACNVNSAATKKYYQQKPSWTESV
jgi:hypothetical protein